MSYLYRLFTPLDAAKRVYILLYKTVTYLLSLLNGALLRYSATAYTSAYMAGQGVQHG